MGIHNNSSGFYYDAKAGWYYSTRDGLYYTFENDGYVPLASSSSSMSITVAEDDNNKSNTAVPEGACLPICSLKPFVAKIHFFLLFSFLKVILCLRFGIFCENKNLGAIC